MGSSINFSGLASGIDSSAIISALLESERRTQLIPIETRVNTLQATEASISTLGALLNSLKSSAEKLRTVNGGALVFSATSSDERVLSARATYGASQSSYQFTVSQLARGALFTIDSTAQAYTSSSALIAPSLSGAGAVSVTTGETPATAETVSISVNSTTTLSQFVSDFNSASSAAEAVVVNRGTESAPDYAISIYSRSTGSAQGTLTLSASAELTSVGFFDRQVGENAANAIVTVAGIGTVQRASNTISDLLPGISLSVQAVGSARVQTELDSDLSVQRIGAFIDDYNKLVRFVEEQNRIVTGGEDGATVEFSPLVHSRSDEGALRLLRDTFASIRQSGTVTSLADLGVQTQRDGTVALNKADFAAALNRDPAAAQGALAQLGERVGSLNGIISQFTRYGGILHVESQSRVQEITTLQARKLEVEKRLKSRESALSSLFGRLEGLVNSMSAQQSALEAISKR